MGYEDRLKTVRVNNADLHYTESGQGQPMVMVHGSLSDFRTWGFQRRFFSKRFRVIAYSRRYHYPNAMPAGESDYSVGLHANDLSAFIQALGPGPCHIIGSSYGAYASLIMAAQHPELTRTIVIGEPPMFPLLKSDREGAHLLPAFLKQVWEPSIRAFEAGNLEEGAKIFYEGITSAGAYDKLSSSARNGMLENALPLKAEAVSRVRFPEFTRQDAQRIQAPCLLLDSELSPRIFHRIADLLESMLPHAERTVIQKASHSMHTDNPKAYNEVVMDFLSRHDREGG